MLRFAKGHGTRNDFVCVADPDDARPLSPSDVRFLCDRRGGVGGDGVLRAVRARHVPEWSGDPELWFMDYRNADGSLAEMCGNGARLFARFLVLEGLVPPRTDELAFATRAGRRTARLLPDGRVRVWMGHPRVGDEPVTVSLGGRDATATPVDVGNPHAVVLTDPDAVPRLDLHEAPTWRPADAFPDGVNVEFVGELEPGRVRMRVFERGVGETPSCGTGTVAAATAVARAHGVREGTWAVEVPGGEVEVELRGGEAWLTGPAEIVARGEVALPKEDG